MAENLDNRKVSGDVECRSCLLIHCYKDANHCYVYSCVR